MNVLYIIVGKYYAEEISTPIPYTARGSFQGVTEEGSIIITGDFNCDGGIVMKFDGLMCIND